MQDISEPSTITVKFEEHVQKMRRILPLRFFKFPIWHFGFILEKSFFTLMYFNNGFFKTAFQICFNLFPWKCFYCSILLVNFSVLTNSSFFIIRGKIFNFNKPSYLHAGCMLCVIIHWIFNFTAAFILWFFGRF